MKQAIVIMVLGVLTKWSTKTTYRFVVVVVEIEILWMDFGNGMGVWWLVQLNVEERLRLLLRLW